ncbi:MAG: DUF4252 domain-containing protein [Chlorobi bacterium]|nr:DUF4252 domain-containing protein [Chlorobiota bacterium]
MKKIISIFVITAIFISCANSKNTIDYKDFYKSHKNDENVISFRVPTSLFSIFLKKEDKDLKHLLKNIDNLNFFIAENSNTDLLSELNNYLPKSNYKDVMIINDSGSKISFKARERNNSISEIIMLIEDDNEFVVMNIEGSFTHEELKKFIESVDTEKVKNSKD